MRFPNGKEFSSYRVVFPELVGDGKIPMQIAEFELLPKLEGSPIDDLSKEATKLLGQIDEVTQKVRYIVSRAHLVPLGEDRGQEWFLTARPCPTQWLGRMIRV
jgi:hypothetical protein